jgi:lipopolysaccharide transport system ATP-binding protein
MVGGRGCRQVQISVGAMTSSAKTDRTMDEIAIRVEHLSKQYVIGEAQPHYDTLRDRLANGLRSFVTKNGRPSTIEIFWALKDVTFQVKRGEVVGIIGRNGAGKSTLLKILSKITEPTDGHAEIHGRVGSLLEVGTGFHQELTGRENVYLSGSILGMRRREIDSRFDEIVAFAEVEKFIDTPVKHFSSGMYLRLAFAVAAHLKPEILLVDEVLAVGDVAFQKKCLGKMDDVARQGRTILFVSHNMAAIAQICERVLFLENGCMTLDGEPSSVVSAYLTSGTTARATWSNPALDAPGDDLHLHSASVLSKAKKTVAVVEFDQGFQVEIDYELYRPIKGFSMACQVVDARGTVVCSSWDSDHNPFRNNGIPREAGRYLSTCNVPGALLRPGRYTLSISSRLHNGERWVAHDNLLSFDISHVGYHFNRNRLGVITPLLQWEVKRLSAC